MTNFGAFFPSENKSTLILDPALLQHVQMQKELENMLYRQRNQPSLPIYNPFQLARPSLPSNLEMLTNLAACTVNANGTNPASRLLPSRNAMNTDPLVDYTIGMHLLLTQQQNTISNVQSGLLAKQSQSERADKEQLASDEMKENCAPAKSLLKESVGGEPPKTKILKKGEQNVAIYQQKTLELERDRGDSTNFLNPKELEFDLDNSVNSWDMNEDFANEAATRETFLEEANVSGSASVKAKRATRKAVQKKEQQPAAKSQKSKQTRGKKVNK